ncbi:hypothetical protein DL96DRAFT_1617583 [Flagelloscypha sp. PMI_526]|nr:hypothetical protein DL96DRAFT_1617583 [Flagelloscypha sp. PMI_526]
MFHDVEEHRMETGSTGMVGKLEFKPSSGWETGASKGFAFDFFESRGSMQSDIGMVNGRGHDSFILSVSWSKSRVNGC